MSVNEFTFNLDETFPQLLRPPIVEAVIHWQALARAPMEPESLKRKLAEKLPMYPNVRQKHGFGFNASMKKGGNVPVVQHENQGFLGMRLTSEDGKTSVQFLRDGLVFSRTGFYQHWEQFRQAAVLAWQVFLEIGTPLETQKLGVRFINHIPAAAPETLHFYLREPPTCPSNLPLREFVYQSTFAVTGHPFTVRVIKVLQPSVPESPQMSGLFLDIDVFSTKAIPNDENSVDDALQRMRWLKNKVFFSLLTEGAIKSFGMKNEG
jgi:uncharacterized protein (TIGR04255 family)